VSARWRGRSAIGALVGAVLLVACARAQVPVLAPLPPPPPAGRTLAEEARQAFGPTLPEDARLVRLPPWAALQAVWGTYDPPLAVDEFLAHVSFIDSRTLVLLGGRGQIWIWDRVDRVRFKSATVQRVGKQQHGLRSRLGEHIARLRSPTFGGWQDNQEGTKKAVSLRKVTLLFLLDTALCQYVSRSETSVENSR